jgi:hypothetical protein
MQGTTLFVVVVDTTVCQKVCLLPTAVMLECQSDELRALRQIAVSCVICDDVLATRYASFLHVVLFHSCIATKILNAFLFSSNRQMPRPSHPIPSHPILLDLFPAQCTHARTHSTASHSASHYAAAIFSSRLLLSPSQIQVPSAAAFPRTVLAALWVRK